MSKRIDFGPVLPIHRGEWKAGTVYERLNTVRHNSASWVCKVASTTVEPSATSTDWFLQTEDSVSVASVNGHTGVVEITNTLTTPAIDDDSTLIANTAWVTDKIEQAVADIGTLINTTASNTLTQATTNTTTTVANAVNQITIASDDKFATKTELDVVQTNAVDIVKDQTIDGVKTFNSTIKGSISGNAGTATKLAAAGTITLAGDATGSVAFDGTNATLTVTVTDDSHNHVISNVDGLQNALNAKAPLASPSLTGTPTAPTAAAGTNTTQVATTAFVKAAVDAKTSIANATKWDGATKYVSTSAPASSNGANGDIWFQYA